MPPHCKCLLRNNGTTDTPLACAHGIYLYNLPASLCRFVREYYQETTPADIGDRFAKSPFH
jgi:hypothetical protein